MPPESQPQVLPTVGGQTCQVSATSEPACHWRIASSTIVDRWFTSSAENRKSPPHNPGVSPVMSRAVLVHFVGSELGSRLCWPEIVC